MTLEERGKSIADKFSNMQEKLLKQAVGPNSLTVERSATIAIPQENSSTNYEKATCQLTLSIPLEKLVNHDSLDAFLSAAENLVEEHVDKFKLGKTTASKPTTAPQKIETSAEPKIPTEGWRLWDSKKGESMGQGSAPRLFDLLEEDGHDEKHPLRHSDGFNYWIYPDSDYIQRARRNK